MLILYSYIPLIKSCLIEGSRMKYMKEKKTSDFKNLLKTIKWILFKSKIVIPFLTLITIITSSISLLGVYNTLVSKSLIDSAISGNTNKVIKYLIIMITIMLSNLLVTPIISLVTTHASMKLKNNFQKNLFKHIEYSSWLEQSKYHSVSLLSRLTSDVDTISSTLLSTIPTIISLGCTLIASFSTLIYLAPSIAFAAIFIGPFLVLISKLLGKKLKTIYKKSQEADIKYKSFIQETLQNIMIVKSFCMENLNMTKISILQNNLYHVSMKNTKLSAFTSLSMSLCSTIAYFSIFCWGALNISTGVTTYGTFTAMLQLYNNVQYPFSSLASHFPKLIASIAAAERLIELEILPLEKSSENTTKIIKPNINFNNVCFQYKKDSLILNNINLNINYGETIALIGPSGEGKTTLIRLILSLVYPTSGQVFLEENCNNVKLNKFHRELISYVPQGNTLFSGTIEDNLKIGNFDATTEELLFSLKSACALDFVNNLAMGIKTVIGEKALGISEGQAQRIAIARSLLRKKPILILDEATSSLDPDTELNVLNAIRGLKHKPTCIIITHRPSALNICNRIIKLEKGTLSEIKRESSLEIATSL